MQQENMAPLASMREKAEIVHNELLSPAKESLQKPSEDFPYDPNTFLTYPTSQSALLFHVKLTECLVICADLIARSNYPCTLNCEYLLHDLLLG